MTEYNLTIDQYPPKWEDAEEHMQINISTKINFSESNEKVSKALKNIFPNLEIMIDKQNKLRGSSTNIEILFHFLKLIFDQRILDVARKCVIDGKENENSPKTVFYLNKQTAFINKVSFSTFSESPLGPIKISIECEKLDFLIDQYFPKFEWFVK